MNIQQKRNKERYEGLVFKTKSCGNAKIINYCDGDNVFIEFTNTGYKTSVYLSQIKSGEIKDILCASICGRGILGNGFKKSDTKSRIYSVWAKMITRCYSEDKRNRDRTYEGCSVSNMFLNFSDFRNWCNSQEGFNSLDKNNKPFHLDKDILVKGNKIYSEATCCFVPQEINTLLITSKRIRGMYPIGVYYHTRDKKYVAKCKVDNKVKSLGCYSTAEEAFCAYKKFKESHIKEVANKWKDQIDSRVYEALLKYEVDIND